MLSVKQATKRSLRLFAAAVAFSGLLWTTHAQNIVADSLADWSEDGLQGESGWYYGYRNVTLDGGEAPYDPDEDFIPFLQDATGELSASNQWTGVFWSLSTQPFEAAPWTFMTNEESHPNDTSSDPFEEQWPIRRYVATDIECSTPVSIQWHSAAAKPFRSSGHTGILYINGEPVDQSAVAFDDTDGITREYFHNLRKNDIIDLAISPVGTDGSRSDSGDTAVNWMLIRKHPPEEAIQPDGTPFMPFVDTACLTQENLALRVSHEESSVLLFWQGRPEVDYEIQESTDLVTWRSLTVVIDSSEDRRGARVPRDSNQPNRFFRVVSKLPSM